MLKMLDYMIRISIADTIRLMQTGLYFINNVLAKAYRYIVPKKDIHWTCSRCKKPQIERNLPVHVQILFDDGMTICESCSLTEGSI